MIISKSFEFDAAHRLHSVCEGHPCRNLHGHRYKVLILLHAKLEEDEAMLFDYRGFSKFKEYIDTALDHSTLVSMEDEELMYLTVNAAACGVAADKLKRVFGKVCPLPIKETTAELLSIFLAQVFRDILGRAEIKLTVKVSETPNTMAFQEV